MIHVKVLAHISPHGLGAMPRRPNHVNFRPSGVCVSMCSSCVLPCNCMCDFVVIRHCDGRPVCLCVWLPQPNSVRVAGAHGVQTSWTLADIRDYLMGKIQSQNGTPSPGPMSQTTAASPPPNIQSAVSASAGAQWKRAIQGFRTTDGFTLFWDDVIGRLGGPVSSSVPAFGISGNNVASGAYCTGTYTGGGSVHLIAI